MFGSNSNNNDESQFCTMDIRKPKQYIKPTRHAKEVREIYEKIVEKSDGHQCSISFYVTKDRLLMSTAFDFAYPISCLDRIEEIIGSTDFLEWCYVGTGGRVERILAPGIYTQEIDQSTVEAPHGGYILGVVPIYYNNALIGVSSRGYGNVDSNNNVFLGYDSAHETN